MNPPTEAAVGDTQDERLVDLRAAHDALAVLGYEGFAADVQKAAAALEAAEKYVWMLHRLCDEQAEDDGLWFEAKTAPEAYLQAALRRLHSVIEGSVI